MAEVVFGAAPINGGTLSISNNTWYRHNVTQLSSTRFLTCMTQTNPNYIIIGVWDVTNQKTETPTATLVRQQVITLNDLYSSISGYSIQCIGLSATTALLIYPGASAMTSAHVLNIDATTGVITTPLASPLAIGTAYFTQCNAAAPLPSGSGAISFESSWCTHEDNNVTVAFRDSGGTGTNLYVYRFQYDPSTNVLTKNLLFSQTLSVDYYYSVTMIRVPNTSTVCVTWYRGGTYANSNSAYYANGNAARTYMVSSTATSATALDTAANLGYPVFMIPLSSTDLVSMQSSKASKYYSTVTGPYLQDSQFASNGGTYTIPANGVAISDSYYGFFATPDTSLPDQRNVVGMYAYFRVVKFTDKNYSQVSPGTAGTTSEEAGIKLYKTGTTSPIMWYLNNILYNSTDNVIAVPYIDSTTSLGLKFIYF